MTHNEFEEFAAAGIESYRTASCAKLELIKLVQILNSIRHRFPPDVVHLIDKCITDHQNEIECLNQWQAGFQSAFPGMSAPTIEVNGELAQKVLEVAK